MICVYPAKKECLDPQKHMCVIRGMIYLMFIPLHHHASEAKHSNIYDFTSSHVIRHFASGK